MRHLFLLITLLLPLCISAQLIESFDGPEINNTYNWKGNLENFIINDQSELQLNARAGSGEDYLYIGSVPLYGNEWSTRVKSDYKATAPNSTYIYLWCEQADIEYPGNGIVVRVGNKDNSIDLCYQRGNIKTEVLIKGRSLCTDAYNVELKVTIDDAGLCTLYTKIIGEEEEFVQEGDCAIPYLGKKGYFMIRMKYSTTHSKDKYVDDIYIDQFTPEEGSGDPEEPGSEFPLELIEIEQEDAHTLYLYFNQVVEARSSSFVLSDLGEVDEVHQGINDASILMLIWENPMKKDKEYTLTYSNLFDESGNEYTESFGFTSYYGAKGPGDPSEPGNNETYEEGCILINEIMADPKGLTELPETEYVELYNASGQTIELKDWQFVYDGKGVELDDYSFVENSYLVLYREGRDIDTGTNGVGMPLSKFPSQLANAGKELQLMDPNNVIIDRITYEKAKAGKSWERLHNSLYLSTDYKGGTPGAANSDPNAEPENPNIPNPPSGPVVEPFDIVFNELLPNPYRDESEYIELYNRSDQSLSLAGLCIATRKSDGTLSTKYPLSDIPVQIESKGYVLLTKSAESVLNNYNTPRMENIHELKIPVLNNNGATLVLFRANDEEIIDEITYSSKWHDVSIKDEKGVALERIEPDNDTQDEKNWTSAAATAGYGTPGYQNSQYGKTISPGEPSGIEKPQYSKDTGIYSILYYLDQPGYKCRAFVYNLSGHQVAQIANNELVGTQGQLEWDGSGSQGTKLNPGPYILYIELYNINGKVKTYKEVFLVH